MRLQQLEIKGFKSFANQTVINFQEDVIGIVGPNGSGKSNIVDAIRWVLGEQKSKELRLDQMSSVIFNGAKKRKPSGVAAVSLTFENTKHILPTEYQAVTITRMLYRSGESEYRLNGVPCRLKDITSLFLDTGIGSNSYAIIALGMVDDILSDKDNSRRRMFEQAAGISKYKIRKRETLNKLQSASEDLERVEDLLHEINVNLKALERQAKRTQRYFELKETYKEYSIELALLQMAGLKKSHQQVKEQIGKEQDAYRAIEAQVTQTEAGLQQERKLHVDKEKALSERQRDLNHLVGSIRNMENERQMLQQKQEFVQQNRTKLEASITDAESRIHQLEEDIEHFRSELNQEKRVESRLELELEEAEKELRSIRESHGARKSDLDKIVAAQQTIERRLFELEKQRAVNSNQMEGAQREKERNAEEVERRKGETDLLKAKIKEVEKRLREQQRMLEELQAAEEKRQANIEQSEKDLEEFNRKMAAVRRGLDAKRNEYKLTKSMVEKLEGFPESIRFLNQNQEWGREAPLLSDLIYVKEEYRVAIENYLEPFLNYYVVEKLEDAYAAIRLLGKSQKGKANFFVLDTFKNYQPPMTLLPDTQRAVDLIETEDRYRSLCGYLLENVLLTDQEEAKGELPDSNIVLLSRSGRFIKRRFSLAGGSIGLFEGKKIGRKKNLEVLDAAISKAEREENRISSDYFNLQEKIQRLKAERSDRAIDEQRTQIARLEQEKVSLATRLENFESFSNDLDVKIKALEQQFGELEEANQEIDSKLDEEQAALQSARDKISAIDGDYRQLAEQLSAASTAYNNKNIAFIRQQNKTGAHQRELNFREKQLTETRTQMEENQVFHAQSTNELERLQSNLETLALQLQDGYAKRKERETSLSEAEQTYFQARSGITELEEQLRTLNRKQQDAQILINTLKDRFNELKYEIGSISQRLRIEFDIGINDIINQDPKGDQAFEELKERVSKLKARLDNYGEINPMAVEAYNEMKERHDSIAVQRDDILEAKASLEQTIVEIEETATTQFLDAFDKTRLYFIEVFRSLFTKDDNCDLLLLEPDNPLESKIEIVAKPKGKRPQSISQLSGGEKTLTATALLFALYLLKPAPFCIFDEVDAPLDDSNILKFNKIIKKFSDNSQFIIVTHNKLTMEAVDVIYGVWAQEGVSGVSPVDFRDFDTVGNFETLAQE